jgi:hypothetical protein
VPLTADDFVQENSGVTVASTSIVVTLPGGTAAGNTLIVIMVADGTVTPPAGFVTDSTGVWFGHKGDVTAAESSWTFTQSVTGDCTWYVAEMTNVDPVEPLDASATNSTGSISNGGTLSSGTTGLNAGLSSVAFAVFYATKQPNAAVTASWGGYTNGFAEVADVSSGSTLLHMAAARAFMDGSTGTFESTATYATSGSSTTANARVMVYRAADAPIAAPLAGLYGFEWGTHGGIGNGGVLGLTGGAVATLGTWGTAHTTQAGSARNSAYGLHIVAAAGLAAVLFDDPGASYGAGSVGFNVRVVSGTGVVVVAGMDNNGSNDLYVVYDTSTNKFGLRWGTGGTPVYQPGTTALNTWVWIDVRWRTNTTTHHAEWRIETAAGVYTDQTPADVAGSATVLTTQFVVGSATSQTATMDFDDLVTSRYYAAYPLGPHEVRLLTVDPAGTPTVSGTSTNFSVFTANGTLAAWNAVNARNAVDEVPPTISASADGVVQTAVAASDYMEFPMQTYTCSSTEIIAGVRMVCPEWGGTGTGTGTLGYRGWDGTTETTFIAASASYDADSLTAASSTYPLWKCAMWPSGVGWTQAELDAAALRIGFSTDATPDMGVHAAYLEVAIRSALVARAHDVEGGAFAVDVRYHPYTTAPVSYLVTTPADRGATFAYTLLGTPASQYVGPGASQVVTLTAATYADVTDTTLQPDPLP